MSTTTGVPRARGAMIKGRTAAVSPPLPEFLPGDIILFAGKGDLYSRVGRWIMQTAGESPTYAVHTAQFLDSHWVLEMAMVARIKSVGQVIKNQGNIDLWQRRGLEVWRCRSLTAQQRAAVTRQALTYLRVSFGMADFVLHLFDGLINKALHREVFLFRRLNHTTRSLVCSEITALAYEQALHYQFGVPADCADPDHIDDWVRTHPDEWVQVFRLKEYAPA